MNDDHLIKNVAFSEPLVLMELVSYQEGQVVSRTLAQNEAITMTLFAFDKGEGISAHTVPGDALVQILDGEASITIGGKTVSAKAGEAVVMPAGIAHALNAEKRFKMMLTLVKKPQSFISKK